MQVCWNIFNVSKEEKIWRKVWQHNCLNLHLSCLLMTRTTNSCSERNEPLSKVVILDDFAFIRYQDFILWLILRFIFCFNFPNIWVLIRFILLPPTFHHLHLLYVYWSVASLTAKNCHQPVWQDGEQDGEDFKLRLSITERTIWDNVSHYCECWLCWLRKHALQDLISRFLASFPRPVSEGSTAPHVSWSGSRNWKASGVCRCLRF